MVPQVSPAQAQGYPVFENSSGAVQVSLGDAPIQNSNEVVIASLDSNPEAQRWTPTFESRRQKRKTIGCFCFFLVLFIAETILLSTLPFPSSEESAIINQISRSIGSSPINDISITPNWTWQPYPIYLPGGQYCYEVQPSNHSNRPKPGPRPQNNNGTGNGSSPMPPIPEGGNCTNSGGNMPPMPQKGISGGDMPPKPQNGGDMPPMPGDCNQTMSGKPPRPDQNEGKSSQMPIFGRDDGDNQRPPLSPGLEVPEEGDMPQFNGADDESAPRPSSFLPKTSPEDLPIHNYYSDYSDGPVEKCTYIPSFKLTSSFGLDINYTSVHELDIHCREGLKPCGVNLCVKESELCPIESVEVTSVFSSLNYDEYKRLNLTHGLGIKRATKDSTTWLTQIELIPGFPCLNSNEQDFSNYLSLFKDYGHSECTQYDTFSSQIIYGFKAYDLLGKERDYPLVPANSSLEKTLKNMDISLVGRRSIPFELGAFSNQRRNGMKNFNSIVSIDSFERAEVQRLVWVKLALLVGGLLLYRCKCASTVIFFVLFILSGVLLMSMAPYAVGWAIAISKLTLLCLNTTSVEWMKWSYLNISQTASGFYFESVIVFEFLAALALLITRLGFFRKGRDCQRRPGPNGQPQRARALGPLRRMGFARRMRLYPRGPYRRVSEPLVDPNAPL